jgi:Phospholipase_D-nuclease N-terminal
MFGGLEFITMVLATVFLLPIALAIFAFWIWMLISAIQNKGLTEGEKIAWVLVIALLHILGALLYFFIGHPKRNTPLPGT